MPTDNTMRLIVEATNEGCSDPAVLDYTMYNPFSFIGGGVNEMRTLWEETTEGGPKCPVCLTPVSPYSECGDYLVPDYITIHMPTDGDDAWCEAGFPSTCMVAGNSGDPCFQWDYGTFNSDGSDCTANSARVTYEQDSETPENWTVKVQLRSLACVTSGTCPTLVFESSVITLSEGGLDEFDVLTQDGLDELNAAIDAGLAVTRTDSEDCLTALTGLTISMEICAAGGGGTLVWCCGESGGVTRSKACECEAAGGTEVISPESCGDSGDFAYCCVDGQVVWGQVQPAQTAESFCESVSGSLIMHSTTILPGPWGDGPTAGDECGGGGPCAEAGEITYTRFGEFWMVTSGEVPDGCCPVGPFPEVPYEGETFTTTLEPCE